MTRLDMILGDVPTRMHRLEEAREVITRLCKNNEPITYKGQFFQRPEAILGRIHV